MGLSRQLPDLRRSTMIEITNGHIEPPHTTKSGRNRNLRHGQLGFIDQLFGEVQAARVCYRTRCGAQMPKEQPSKVT